MGHDLNVGEVGPDELGKKKSLCLNIRQSEGVTDGQRDAARMGSVTKTQYGLDN